MANEFNLGINTGAVEYYEEGLPFKDLMKNGRLFRADSVSAVPGFEGSNMRLYYAPSSFPTSVWFTNSNRVDSGASSDGSGYPLARFIRNGQTGYTNPYKPLISTDVGHVSGALPFSSSLYPDQAIIHMYYDGASVPNLRVRYGGNLVAPTLVSSTAGEQCYTLSSHLTWMQVDINNGWVGNLAPEDYIRNIRIVHEDYKDNYLTEPFVPASKSLVVSATTSGGPVRNLDWCKINNSPVSSVSQLVTKDMHFQGSRYGVSWEYMAQYANEVNRPLWVCVPHLAGRDVLSAIASTLYNTLDSDKEVYVEYSNETWNSTFVQYSYLQDTANNSPASSTFELPVVGADDRSRGRGLGVLSSLQAFDVFEKYFPADRLTRVIAHQKTGTRDNYMKAMLLYENAYSSVDMWAVAPYAANYLGNNAQAASSVSGWTVDEVMDWVYSSVSAPMPTGSTVSGFNSDAISGVPHLLSSTETYNGTALGDLFSAISPGCYESGQHLNARGNAVGNNDDALSAIGDLFRDCQDSPRMTDFYEFYYNYLRDNGFKTVCGFVDVGGWGIDLSNNNVDYWGLVPYYGYEPARKLEGATSFIASLPDPGPGPDPTPPPALATEQLGYRIDINVDININFN